MDQQVSGLSGTQAERARKNHGQILAGMARVGQVHLAAAIGVHESTVSKMKDGDLERLAMILAVMDFKIVSTERVCVHRHEYITMTKIVSRALANEEIAARLLFEDPE